MGTERESEALCLHVKVSEHPTSGPDRDSPERKPHGNLNSDDKKSHLPQGKCYPSVSLRQPFWEPTAWVRSKKFSFHIAPSSFMFSVPVPSVLSLEDSLLCCVGLGCDLQTV